MPRAASYWDMVSFGNRVVCTAAVVYDSYSGSVLDLYSASTAQWTMICTVALDYDLYSGSGFFSVQRQWILIMICTAAVNGARGSTWVLLTWCCTHDCCSDGVLAWNIFRRLGSLSRFTVVICCGFCIAVPGRLDSHCHPVCLHVNGNWSYPCNIHSDGTQHLQEGK